MHEKYIQRCFQLAQFGEGYVSPNPLVGSVLVYNDTIIGEGYHHQFGEAHAEVNCINSVSSQHKDLIAQSTLYVNLEPCSHHGKTPPCVDLIIKNGIKKVVISNKDTHELVAGKGIEMLRTNNIEVIDNVLEKEGWNLNRAFFISNKNKRPFIILKWAESLDGYIGKANERVQISGKMSQIMAHQLRKKVDAILVGKKTILCDNPSLTTRFVKGKNPKRIIWSNTWNEDKKLFSVFDNEAETIVTGELQLFSMNDILQYLYQQKNGILLVEGGSQTLSYFIEHGIWDEAIVFVSKSKHIGEGILAPKIARKYLEKSEQNTADFIHYFLNKN